MDGQQLFGMLTRDAGGAFLLLDPEGKTTRINEGDIEEVVDSELSSMPDGLMDQLSMEEILHLFTLPLCKRCLDVDGGDGFE